MLKKNFTACSRRHSQLPWLCERILETNPGSVALLSASIDSKVRRFFVSFYASLHGFEKGCRPIIFLDRIPLKANTRCKLLAAAAVDGDNAIFPLAFASVEDETFEIWIWFLSQLTYAVGASRVITFVSNRQKGLDEAIPQVFEESHHGYCLRHLIEDFKLELKKLGPWSQQVRDAMVDDFIRAAQACNIEYFNASIESIRNVSTDVAEWVLGSKPENWSDAIFRGSRYDHLSSNIVDLFSNWIPVKSESSIVQIVEAVRNKLMDMIQLRREVSSGWVSTLTPSMEQKLEREMSKAWKLNVLCSSETVFEVRGNTIFVNIGSWECTCRRWQISGLPCLHVIAVCNRINRSVHDYCSKYFTTECYHSAYSELIHPIPDVASIDFNNGANMYPPARRPPGRPRRKRFNPNKQVTVIRVCSRCKVAGNNKGTCEAFL